MRRGPLLRVTPDRSGVRVAVDDRRTSWSDEVPAVCRAARTSSARRRMPHAEQLRLPQLGAARLLAPRPAQRRRERRARQAGAAARCISPSAGARLRALGLVVDEPAARGAAVEAERPIHRGRARCGRSSGANREGLRPRCDSSDARPPLAPSRYYGIRSGRPLAFTELFPSTTEECSGDRARGRAERLASGGEGVGPRPRGPAPDLPQHADHPRRRGARAHPLPAGEDPRLVLHRPRQRGLVGRRRDGDGPRRRRHAAPPRHGRAHHARRRAVADLRAVHGPRRRPDARARTATSTWPTCASA